MHSAYSRQTFTVCHVHVPRLPPWLPSTFLEDHLHLSIFHPLKNPDAVQIWGCSHGWLVHDWRFQPWFAVAAEQESDNIVTD